MTKFEGGGSQSSDQSGASPETGSNNAKILLFSLICAAQRPLILPELPATLAANRFGIRVLDFDYVMAVRSWTPF